LSSISSTTSTIYRKKIPKNERKMNASDVKDASTCPGYEEHPTLDLLLRKSETGDTREIT
jgi:hypothetical protein